MEVLDRFFKPPDRSFLLFGPRGTGKSLLTQVLFPDALRVDLLDPESFRVYSAHPERLRQLVEGTPRASCTVIDEVQKVPELLSVVHALLEERRRYRFVLTGSSARKLRRAGVDLMAGRAVLKSLHPFMAAELGRRFSLERALRVGMVPLVIGASGAEEVLASYAALYLREEVQMEGLVRNISAFSRFLEAISFSHAGLLNVSTVASDCAVERKTVEGYVSILEDLLLGFRLPVFSKRARRAVVAHPKFYFFDAGVYRSLRPAGPLDRPEEIEGAALEGLVAQHLRAWAAYTKEPHDIYYWRTRAGAEVDFVLYGPRGLWAFEVKNASRVRPDDLRSLRAFKSDYPRAQCRLLYRGRSSLAVADVICQPVADFLLGLRPGADPVS